ncbi:MAG: hypothetical protein JHD35_25105, partial [Sphingopyxis sp.]|nr:hypothetical protein [Sphingopyxis sp.]
NGCSFSQVGASWKPGALQSVLALGLVVASVSAFAAIWALMRVLERFSAWPFVIYRGTLGVLLLVATSNAWLI